MKLNLPTVAALGFALFAVNAYSKATKPATTKPSDPLAAQQGAALRDWTDGLQNQWDTFAASMTASQGHVTSSTPFGFFTI